METEIIPYLPFPRPRASCRRSGNRTPSPRPGSTSSRCPAVAGTRMPRLVCEPSPWSPRPRAQTHVGTFGKPRHRGARQRAAGGLFSPPLRKMILSIVTMFPHCCRLTLKSLCGRVALGSTFGPWDSVSPVGKLRKEGRSPGRPAGGVALPRPLRPPAPPTPAPGPAAQRPLAAACAPALSRPSRGAPTTAAPQFPSGVPVSYPLPRSRKILGLPEPYPRSWRPTPLAGPVTPLPGGRRASSCPGLCGTRGGGPVSSGSGREEHFRGAGGAHVRRRARGRFRGAGGGCPRSRGLGAGLGPRSLGRARLGARAAGLRPRSSVGPRGPRPAAAAAWPRR